MGGIFEYEVPHRHSEGAGMFGSGRIYFALFTTEILGAGGILGSVPM